MSLRGAKRVVRAVAVALLVEMSTGCMASSYLVQAGRGQLDITYRARSLSQAIRDPRTPARTRELLGKVSSMKRFAEANGLTPTSSYEEYVDVGRGAVVWVVSACEPLGWRTKNWSFPIVGSVPYLGWFHRDDAVEFAADLRKEGWDVDVRGADAYSTLGWFSDPVLSSMVPDDDQALGDLADTVLHESVHATVYVKGQTPFNESIASFIADKIVLGYLAKEAGPNSVEMRSYLAGEEAGGQRALALHRAYERLDAVFTSSESRAEKLAQKRRIYADLAAEIHTRRPLNNAALVQFKTYATGSPELEALLTACGGDVKRLVGALRTLGPASFTEPHTKDLRPVLAPLIQRGCPAR